MDNAYAVIIAGGVGTRLWPLSRRERPKPLLKLVNPERSMFQVAVDRLRPMFPVERILVVANPHLSAQLQAQAPELPADNFIKEPMGRDTAPAVGLAAIHVRHRDPNAVLSILTADHHIKDQERFRQVLSVAYQVAAEGDIVTLGIKPHYPSTGFGYIEQGEHHTTLDGVKVYTLNRFVEKPDEERAKELLATQRYSWNSGMFIWQADRVMREFAQHAPELSTALEKIAAAIGTAGYDQVIGEVWPEITRISVDYALMEHINAGIRVIPVEMGWADIGNFDALHAILADDRAENVVGGSSPTIVDSEGSVIFSDKLVAVIGVDDIVIVDTKDALLICRRDRAQDVKKLVQQLKERELDEYL